MKAKIDIVSGFLGAGKTSLIKKLAVEGFKREKIVVIENEFGKVGIDGALLKGGNIQVRELGSGCICCSLVDDLMTTIPLVNKEFGPDRIIIEPSGVALLSDLKRVLKFKEIADITELGMIITVVDASRFHIHKAFAEDFVSNQIKSSKTLILSKTEGVDENRIEDIVKELHSINSDANIITTDWQKLSALQIINTAKRDSIISLKDKLPKKIVVRKLHVHGPGCSCGCGNNVHLPAKEVFQSWETITSKKYSMETLTQIFNELKDESKYGVLLRGKGILESPHGGWIHFDYVPYELKTEDYDIECSGMICLIGKELNKENISLLFDNI